MCLISETEYNDLIYIYIIVHYDKRELPTFYARRFANVVFVTQAQLTPVVAAENEESASFWKSKRRKQERKTKRKRNDLEASPETVLMNEIGSLEQLFRNCLEMISRGLRN